MCAGCWVLRSFLSCSFVRGYGDGRPQRLGAQLVEIPWETVWQHAAFTVVPWRKVLGRKEPNYRPAMVGFGFVRSLGMITLTRSEACFVKPKI